MGDSALWSGQLTFSRPLRWAEYRGLEVPSLLRVREERATEDTEDGPLERRTAIGLSPARTGEPWGKIGYLADALYPWVEHLLLLDVRVLGHLYTGGDLAPTRHWVEYRERGMPEFVVRHETAVVAWRDGTSAFVRNDDGWWVPGNGPALFLCPAREGVQE